MTILLRSVILLVSAIFAALTGTAPAHSATPTPSPAEPAVTRAVPRPAHVVIVVMENHSYGQIIGNREAPYINSLAAHGASFTAAHAVTHPSEPNYLALFSGSTQGVTSDACPLRFSGPNLATSLAAKHLTFRGFSENMPADGYTGCGGSTGYARKHNPWVDFTNVPASSNLRLTRFPARYASLPTVSFVIPNLCHDMHDCSVATGDSWLRQHLSGYVDWARTNNSLLVLTFDEAGHGTPSNQIATVFVGQHVKPGRYGITINHYSVLRAIEDMYGLPKINHTATASSISMIWQ